MMEASTLTARVTILMRATTAVPSTALAATVTATTAEAARKYSTSRFAIESIDFEIPL